MRLKNASGTVRWTSSNKAVATVTSKGVVKGIKAGSAFIKAYYKEKPINVRSLWKP
ncbi:MAG: Ig-like domain-containing protein [Lachnospiraceae bacterium]